MKKNSDNRMMVLKAFLSRCPPEKSRALEKFLPEGERLLLEKIPPFEGKVTVEGFSNSHMLENVHWSWFLPTLKTYPELEQELFLSALSTVAAKNLAKALNIFFFQPQKMADIAKVYLRQILLHSLIGPENHLLPMNFLSPTPLTPLLQFSKKELIRLIDSLSIYDLAVELRQIVETKILKKIYSFLSEEERGLLKSVTAHKEHYAPARIGLDRWDGSEESLRLLLHKRGLARLGAALSGQESDFIWYLCHQLDIGRGNALFKLCAKEAIPGVSDAIIRQILDFI